MRRRSALSGASFCWSLVNCIILVVFAYLISTIWTHPDRYQGDFKIYYFGARAFGAGVNPYDLDALQRFARESTGMASMQQPQISDRFVYTPLSLPIFELFARLRYETASRLFLTIKLIALIFLIIQWRQYFLANLDRKHFLLFLMVAYNAAVFIDLFAGNISIFEQAFLWLAFYYLHRDKLLWFCAFLGLAACFKLVPLLFVVALWLSPHPRRWYYAAGLVGAYTTAMVTLYMGQPVLLSQFFRATRQLHEYGLYAPSSHAFIADLCNYLSQFGYSFLDDRTAACIYLGWVALVVLLTVRLMATLKPREDADNRIIAIFVFCLAYALIMPRFKDYSYILLVPATYFVWRQCAAPMERLLMAILIVLPFTIGFLPVVLTDTPAGYLFQYAPLWLALLTWWQLRRCKPKGSTVKVLPFALW